MRFTNKTVVLLTATLAMAAASGCTTASQAEAPGTSQEPGPSSAVSDPGAVNEEARALLPQSIRDKGSLVLATDPTYPPFEYFDTDNKTVIGWDVDMGNALATSLGLKAQYVPATFDTILPGLASNKYDAGMSAFNVTEERQKVVDFVPYISGGSGMAVLPGNPAKLAMTASSLCGKKVAAQKGTHEAIDILPAMSQECTDSGASPIDQAVFPTQTDANLALLSGRVDGVMADSIPLAYQGTLAGNKFELAAGSDYEPRLSGMALNKESGLRPAITAAMKAIVQSKTYADINTRWGIPSTSSITAEQVSG